MFESDCPVRNGVEIPEVERLPWPLLQDTSQVTAGDPSREDVHQLVNLGRRVADQLWVGATFKNDTPAHVKDLVEVPQEVDTVCHDNPSLGSQ